MGGYRVYELTVRPVLALGTSLVKATNTELIRSGATCNNVTASDTGRKLIDHSTISSFTARMG